MANLKFSEDLIIFGLPTAASDGNNYEELTLRGVLMNLRTRQTRPTIAELLDELSEIHKSETVAIETPTREDRLNAMIEVRENFRKKRIIRTEADHLLNS